MSDALERSAAEAWRAIEDERDRLRDVIARAAMTLGAIEMAAITRASLTDVPTRFPEAIARSLEKTHTLIATARHILAEADPKEDT
jgi:hypothetical protein